MELKTALLNLKEYIEACDEIKMKEQADFINQNFTSEKDLDEIENFMRNGLKEISDKTEDLIKFAESTLIQMKLKEIKEIVSLAYISKKYFNKDRSWIHQKINGNLKNGKPAKFSAEEIETFNFALQDISKKIGSVAM